MDGLSAKEFTEHLVRSSSRPDIIKRKKTFDFMHQGAQEFCKRVNARMETQDITTVADQASYDLEPNFERLFVKTEDPRGGDYFVRYYDTSNYYEVRYKAFQKIWYDYNTTSVLIPSWFTIHKKTSLPDQMTGATTSDGNESGGEATLTDTGESFETYVRPGDIVHNTTSNYSGVVLVVTDDENLVTAMFDTNGDAKGWTSGDGWVLQPTVRRQLQLDAPPSTAGHTVTIPYIAKPNPVYSYYRTWQIDDQFHGAFCFWAAYLYLMEMQVEEQPSANMTLGQIYRTEFERIVIQAKNEIDKAMGKAGFSMIRRVR